MPAALLTPPTLGDRKEVLMTHPTDSSDFVIDRVDWYRELLREDPSSVLFCDLAQDLCSMGLWRDAVQVLRAGLHYHPRHMRGHALLGWALWEFGAAEEAQKALKLVKREMEKIAVAYRVLAEISTHEGNIEDANRYDTIHSLMLEGREGPELQAAVPIRPVREREVTPRMEPKQAEDVSSAPVEPLGLLSFLSALRDGFREEEGKRMKPLKVFSGEDRMALEQLIHVHAGLL